MHDSTGLNDAGPGSVRYFSDPFILFYLMVVVLSVLLAVEVGFRDPTVGTDTANYINFYDKVVFCECFPGQFDIGFEAISYFFAVLGFTSSVMFFSLSLLSFFLVFLIASKVSRFDLSERDGKKLLMVSLAAFLISPFFLGSQINVIRQGLSVLFLFLAIFDTRNGFILKSLMWGLLSLSFHHTAALSLLSLSILVLGRRAVLLATVIMFILYVSGSSEAIVMFVSDLSGFDLYGRVSEYAPGTEYKAGVRLDFAVFSIAIPIFAVLCSRLLCSSFEYIGWVVSVYLSLLMPFWFFGWANYSDRFALTAWLFASIVFSIGLMPIIKRFSVGVVSVPVLISFIVFWYCLVNS